MSKTAVEKDYNPEASELSDDGTDAEWNQLRKMFGPYIVCYPGLIQTLLDELRAGKLPENLGETLH